MTSFQVDVAPLVAALQGIASRLPGVVSDTLDSLAEIGVTNAKSSRLFKNQTGKLRREIKFTRNGEFSREVVSPTSYAPYVEFGNNQKGAKIYPIRAKALRFVVNGEVIFRKWVRSHPPLPFMGNARELVLRFIPDMFNDQISKLIESYNK